MSKFNIKKMYVIALFCVFLFSMFNPGIIGTLENMEVKADEDSSFSLNLVSKSNGLDTPRKEEGKTEYEVADINNDGYLDIISVGDHGNPYVNSEEHGIMVWLGDGGNYWDVRQTGNFGYGGCAIGDLNLDGKYDIAWGVHHNYTTDELGDTIIDAALGDGTGENWSDWGKGLASNGENWGMFATAFADFDLDGDLDLISESFGCCNGLHLYENLGNGSWSQAWSYTGGNVMYTVETCDFNNDGYPDFVATHEEKNAFLGDGKFGFTNVDNGLPVGSIYAIDCGDMNNDGSDDLVAALEDNGVKCYIYDDENNKWVSKSSGLPSSGSYYLAQFGDLNGDGNLDIVAYSDPTGTVYLGDGHGTWSEDTSWNMPSPGDYSAMRVDGDVDHDGREDIVIQAAQGSWPTMENTLRLYSPWKQPTDLTALVQTPHGGEVFGIGSIRDIRWLSAVPSSKGAGTVDIKLSTNGESGPWTTIASNLPNNGRYQWLVDADESSMCRIKIIVKTGSETTEAISADDFIISYGGNVFRADANGPYYGEPYENIQFTGSAHGGTPPYTYTWDFGDGNTSDIQNPLHSYSKEGQYIVKLIVTDSEDKKASDYTTANIETPNIPPTADFTYTPQAPSTDDTIQFLDKSIDEDGTIEEWYWRFGDGETSTAKNPVHRYQQKGLYTVSLRVTDDDGGTDTMKKDLTVSGTPPTAYIDSITPNPADQSEIIHFIGHGEDADGYVISYHWESSIDGFLSDQSEFNKADMSPGQHIIYFRVKDNDDIWSQFANTTLLINSTQPPDVTPPVVRIIKPEKALYVNNKEIISFIVPLVIGGIDIEIEAADEQSGVKNVELYINEQQKANLTSEPYIWRWDEKGFGRYILKTIAYDNENNKSTEELLIWKFF